MTHLPYRLSTMQQGNGTKNDRSKVYSTRILISIALICLFPVSSFKLPIPRRPNILKINEKKGSASPPSTKSEPSSATTIIRTDTEEIAIPLNTPEEDEFFARTKDICHKRNIAFGNIKNARDLSQVPYSPIKPNKVVRMGRVSAASPDDVDILFGDMKVKTFIDLRSPTELREDEDLNNVGLFGNVTSLLWRGNNRKVKELKKVLTFSRRKRVVNRVADAYKNRRGRRDAVEEEVGAAAFVGGSLPIQDEDDEYEYDFALIEEPYEMDALDDSSPIDSSPELPLERDISRKERYFVSLMNEFKYVRGTLSKLRKRDIARAVIKSPGAIVSKKVRNDVINIFISEINDGGLPMLNQLLLRFAAPGIKYVLETISDETRHPVAFYCTAGKDRTGIISAILLSLCGVPDEQIIEDYSLSANVYAEMNDHQVMVGALSQRNLDPKTFLGAPPQVMRETLEALREDYGGLEGYLDFIGFGKEKREKLKKVLMEE